MAALSCEQTKNHSTLYFKRVKFMLSEHIFLKSTRARGVVEKNNYSMLGSKGISLERAHCAGCRPGLPLLGKDGNTRRTGQTLADAIF